MTALGPVEPRAGVRTPSPGSDATGGLPRISRTSPKPSPPSSPSLLSSSPSGGLHGRGPWPQQCRSGWWRRSRCRQPTFAARQAV